MKILHFREGGKEDPICDNFKCCPNFQLTIKLRCFIQNRINKDFNILWGVEQNPYFFRKWRSFLKIKDFQSPSILLESEC